MIFCGQRDRNDVIIGKWIDMWRNRNKLKKLYRFWAAEAGDAAQEKRSIDFCQAFYERGLLFRSMRHMKLFA